MTRRLAVLISILAFAAAPALAQATAEQKEKARAAARACRADAQKFCQGVQPGGGRLVACLQGHEADLSAGCRDTLKGVKR